MDNHLVSRAFSLYAELLQLHGQGERLSDWLSGAAYRIRQLDKPVTDMSGPESSTATSIGASEGGPLHWLALCSIIKKFTFVNHTSWQNSRT